VYTAYSHEAMQRLRQFEFSAAVLTWQVGAENVAAELEDYKVPSHLRRAPSRFGSDCWAAASGHGPGRCGADAGERFEGLVGEKLIGVGDCGTKQHCSRQGDAHLENQPTPNGKWRLLRLIDLLRNDFLSLVRVTGLRRALYDVSLGCFQLPLRSGGLLRSEQRRDRLPVAETFTPEVVGG